MAAMENWIEVRGRKIFWNGTPIDFGTLKQYVALTKQMTPTPYLKIDLDKAEDCAFATKTRNIIAANFSCSEAACWQGSREAFDVSKSNPDRFFAPF